MVSFVVWFGLLVVLIVGRLILWVVGFVVRICWFCLWVWCRAWCDFGFVMVIVYVCLIGWGCDC